MKNNTFLLLLIVLIIGCKKDDVSPTTTTQNPNQTTQPTLNFHIKPTRVDMTNIVVNDTLMCNLEIDDQSYTAGTVYVLKPKTDSKIFHRKNKEDYNFCPNQKNSLTVDSIVYTATSGSFALKILLPGTFQHQYDLYRLVDGKKVGETVSVSIIFYAVKITAETAYNNYRSADFFTHSKWHRDYSFFVDCGDQKFDNYLYSQPVNYSTNWWANGYNGTLGASKNVGNKFRDTDDTESGPFNLNGNYTLTNVVLTPTSDGVPTSPISYKNIPITERQY